MPPATARQERNITKQQPMNSIHEIIHIGLLIIKEWKDGQKDATKCITSLLP